MVATMMRIEKFRGGFEVKPRVGKPRVDPSTRLAKLIEAHDREFIAYQDAKWRWEASSEDDGSPDMDRLSGAIEAIRSEMIRIVMKPVAPDIPSSEVWFMSRRPVATMRAGDRLVVVSYCGITDPPATIQELIGMAVLTISDVGSI